MPEKTTEEEKMDKEISKAVEEMRKEAKKRQVADRKKE